MAKFYNERQALPFIWSLLIQNAYTNPADGKMYSTFKCEGKLGFARITELVAIRRLLRDNHLIVVAKNHRGRTFEILHSPEKEETYSLPKVQPAEKPLQDDVGGYDDRKLYTAGLYQWLLNRTHPRNRKWQGKIRYIPADISETGLLYHFRILEALGYIRKTRTARGYKNGEWQIFVKD